MDTSHLAEHAGTAGAVFASVFVVATTTMRTMIPLRIFGILTNIVLITTAIPGRNYPVILVQVVVLVFVQLVLGFVELVEQFPFEFASLVVVVQVSQLVAVQAEVVAGVEPFVVEWELI